MCFQKYFRYSFCAVVLAAAFSSTEYVACADNEQKSNAGHNKASRKKPSAIDGSLNLKFAHERSNKFVLGPQNCSAIGFTPVVSLCNNLQIESDFYYGRQYTYNSIFASKRNLSRITDYEHLTNFYDGFNDKYLTAVRKQISGQLEKPHFYRSYSRMTTQYRGCLFALGDVSSKNSYGFQLPLSGAGIFACKLKNDTNSISSTLTSRSCINIVRPSKVECKLGDDVLGLFVLAPGVYTIDSLPEEAKIPGATLRINDQLGRSEVIKIDCFGQYAPLDTCEDEFEVIAVCNHKWHIDNPSRTRYNDSPRYSANYKCGYMQGVTLFSAAQAYNNGFICDVGTILSSDYGTFAPDVAYSHDSSANNNSVTQNAVGVGCYYAIPENKYGLMCDVYASVKSRGFSNLGIETDNIDYHVSVLEKFITNNDARSKLLPSDSRHTSKSVIARLYAKSIKGITPSFVFYGVWEKERRLREYTINFTTKFKFVVLTFGAGLTYDDPQGGRNARAPDRRFLASFTIPIGKSWEAKTYYSHYDDELRKTFMSTTYSPAELPGFSISAERTAMPGRSIPKYVVKYGGDYGELKFEENVSNSYANKSPESKTSHSNQQKIFIGTNVSKKGISKFKKYTFNSIQAL